MPTNKLWIEHTERAAWESVSALRSELAETKKRLERLAPPVEGWQALVAALDALKEEHALGGKTYADVVRGVVDRLALVEGRLRAAQQELARAHLPAVPPATRSEVNARPERGSSRAPTAEEAREFETIARRFVRAMQRRHAALAEEGAPAGVEELLGAISAKVEELEELEELELADATVDLAVLALFLHRDARGGTG